MKTVAIFAVLFGVLGFTVGMLYNAKDMHLVLAVIVAGKFYATTGAALGGVIGYYLQK